MVMDKITTAIKRIIDDGLGSELDQEPEIQEKESTLTVARSDGHVLGMKLHTQKLTWWEATCGQVLCHPEAATTETDLELESSNEIEVGDCVTISDCPGHWGIKEQSTAKITGDSGSIARLINC